MNNKSSLKNLNFTRKNIIEVKSIYNMENINTLEDLESGPILLVLQTKGETFDFGLIINDKGLNYFIGGPIGLNKTSEDLHTYQEKIFAAHDRILNNLKLLTGKTITELKFLVILTKNGKVIYKKNLRDYTKIRKI